MEPNETFLKLLLRHQGDLKAFIASVVADRTASEDLFQEVCLALWQGFASYDPSRPFGAWARGVAVHKVLRSREQARHIPLAFSPEAIQAVLEAYDRSEPPAPRTENLRDCISRLPDRSRQLLALRYDQGLKLGEMARRAGSSLDAVHKLLSRVRAAVQDCLARKLAAEERA